MINKEKDLLQKDVFEEFKKTNFNCTCIIPTGFGKTKIIIDSLNYLREFYRQPLRILYVCDNKQLRDLDFPNELIKWDATVHLEQMDRLCYQSAYKLENLDYDVLVCDELDFGLSKEYRKLFNPTNKFKHIIGVSATLESEEKREFIQTIIPIVYEKKMKDLNNKDIVNKTNFYIVPFKLNPEENKRYLSFNYRFKKLLGVDKPNNFLLNLLKTERKHFLGALDSSWDVCVKLLKKIESNSNNKTLVFCSLSSQADRLTEYTLHTKNQKDNFNLELLNNGDIKTLAVIGKVDRGVNLKGVNCCVIEAPFNSGTKSVQKTGRMKRLSINEVAYIFYLVPHFIDEYGHEKPTIVLKWVHESTKDLDPKFKYYKL